MDDELTRALRRGGRQDGEALRAASRRLAERAEREGLVDVAYATVESPLGDLLAAATAGGLVMLAYRAGDDDALLARLAAGVSPRVVESPARLDRARRELEEYFAGRRRRFELPIDWSLTRGYAREVLQRTAEIPYGEARTYGEIAAAAGSPRGWRAAGTALGGNLIPIVVPCHRVVRSNGVGGYTGGLDRKRFLLALEAGEEPG